VPVQYPPDPTTIPFSVLDRQVIYAIAEGERAKDVAKALGIKRKELGVIYDELLTKTGLKSWTALAVWAVRNGLV
jgi:DNA-binding NarL/FixJ family response regulator